MNKPDYNDPCICIDCTGFSGDKKKRVQDAFFKLGYRWSGEPANTYWGFDKDFYNTNKNMTITYFRAESLSSMPNIHTYEQLMERAGMSEKTDLDKLQATYAEMGKQIKQLQAEAELNKNKRAFGFLPKSGGGVYWVAVTNAYGVYICAFGNNFNIDTKKGIYFKTEAECQDWCDALNVQNELRNCAGVRRYVEGEANYVIYLNDSSTICTGDNYRDMGSIYFETNNFAQKAIETIGKDRLIKAFKVLS